ncbi:Zinc finger family protein putative isoform 1 [Tripterygium wilfordii]|uniref:Zinc finger family protein putative isoform 1 n=1 Tax=Tripterygium wilfordii TaxID=458696 RepID=A0A7J7CKH3_TRIWF|nr:Zinc finger family protein putative isoform 1 [Tripterygium wilfordii]
MAASRFSLLGSAALFLRSRKPLILKPPLLSNKPFSLKHLQFHLYSSSTALDAVSSDNTETLSFHHPWPEWVTFVDHLKTKGYLMEAASVKAESESASYGDSDADNSVYQDINLLKDPCLSFARDRYDIFKLLSMQDVQTVVEAGCPNLFRKAVNSAKRLRAHVRLDEGDVCSACNLRGSCDKAYVIVKGSEGTARTVDIVRILLFYALDPLVFSQKKPPGRQLVEESARKLISELIELSEISPSPPSPKPAPAKASKQKETAIDIDDDELPPNVEMKRGDWMCPKCNFMNFSRNVQCRECKEDGPKKVGGAADIEMKKGDWICPECSFMNFSRNTRCLKCKTEGPKRLSTDEVEMKKGDWNCPKCDFLNYRKNMVCLKCNCERPKDTRTDHEEHLWKRPNARSKY